MKALRSSILATAAGALLFPTVALADNGNASTNTTTGSTNVVAVTSPRPIQLALVPDVQLVPQEQSITGFRLNIYGCNQDVTGVDIGLVHQATGNFKGAQFGIVNKVDGDSSGMQLAGIFSETRARMTGWQVGMGNHAGYMKGVQLGFVNMADDMTGIQIGLVNIINSKTDYKALPLINAKF
ncbi:MAG TPA: hypothetical protein VL486_14640 [Verrucomicrobiae bacterium]|nr:hypothetical protein [Verrucomicrobiae bacterium]